MKWLTQFEEVQMSTVDLKFVLRGIAEALEIDEDAVTVDSVSGDLEEWDSLGHISIMSFLDKSFGEITERVPDFASATSVREIISLLEQNT
jgi:acyl carrier protein